MPGECPAAPTPPAMVEFDVEAMQSGGKIGQGSAPVPAQSFLKFSLTHERHHEPGILPAVSLDAMSDGTSQSHAHFVAALWANKMGKPPEKSRVSTLSKG